MNFKVFVCFHDDGSVREVCLDREDCKDECVEYIAKLIPIERDHDIKLNIKDVTKSLEQSSRKLMKEKTELERTIRRFKIKF
jgi:hypothetical protein